MHVKVARAWYVVGILTLIYAISFVDRFILALLAEPVGRELQLGDGQMGILLGAGFAIVYALAGLPAAQLIDQRERRKIVTLGVSLWSAGTVISAFADGFAMLATCRASVALGEAVLTPAAISLIADLFPAHKRALPMSVYASMSGLMTIGSFVIGGATLGIATSLEAQIGLSPWRGTLLIVGFPGLLLALLFFLTVREPLRSGGPATIEDTAFSAFLRYLSAKWRFYLPFYLGSALLVMYAYANLAWLPTLLVRAHGADPATAGYLIGLTLPAAMFGIFFFPWLSTRLDRAGEGTGIVRAFLIASIAGAPFLILAPLAGTTTTLLLGVSGGMICLATTGSLGPLAMQAFGPSRMRARLMALSLLCTSMLGFAIGPTAVGLLSTQWQGDPMSLGRGLSVLGMVAGPGAILCFALALRGTRQMLTANNAIG